MIKQLVEDLRALPALFARLIDALETIENAIHRANIERAREQARAEQAQTPTLEATRAVCPLCQREWRAMSPARVALLEWTQGNRASFVIVVTHGNAQHIVHDPDRWECSTEQRARVPSPKGKAHPCPHGYVLPCEQCEADRVARALRTSADQLNCEHGPDRSCPLCYEPEAERP